MDSLAEYTISMGGRERKARLLRLISGNSALIELDGKTIEVSFPQNLSFDKPASVSVNGKKHTIKLSRNDRPQAFSVDVDGKRFTLQLKAERKKLNRETSPFAILPVALSKRRTPVVKKSGAVTSLMPGKVVLLKVKAGDEVKVGEPLCVLEAMKMENEIVAPKSGRIIEVNVEQGSVVDKGDILFVVE